MWRASENCVSEWVTAVKSSAQGIATLPSRLCIITYKQAESMWVKSLAVVSIIVYLVMFIFGQYWILTCYIYNSSLLMLIYTLYQITDKNWSIFVGMGGGNYVVFSPFFSEFRFKCCFVFILEM